MHLYGDMPYFITLLLTTFKIIFKLVIYINDDMFFKFVKNNIKSDGW